MISSDNLYHFTPQFEFLISIVRTRKLRISYCLERFDWLNNYGIEFETFFGKPREKEQISIGIPMTCFCDIPSNLISTHSKIYGYYGIGFKESFRKRLALNPLFYITDKSSVTTLMQVLYTRANLLNPDCEEYVIKNKLDSLLAYCKPYEGHFAKGNYNNENHKYYDEREWRYVIPDVIHSPLSETDYNKLENKHVGDLGFILNEVSVIVVCNESERQELLKICPDLNIEIYDDFTKAKK